MTISLEGLRVLVFGKERDSVEWLRKSLIHHGALVSSVESPKKVLRVLKNIRMDLLIVDCHASTDAYQLINAIRLRDSRSGAHERLRMQARAKRERDSAKPQAMRAAINENVPAVLLTKEESAQTRNEALAAGFQEQLKKPVQLDRLLQVARELTARSTKHTSTQAG